MKTKAIKQFFLPVSFFIVLFLSSCLDEQFNEIMKNSKNFNYKTTIDLNVSINVLDNANKPMNGVYIEIYTSNPLNEAGILIPNAENFLVFKGITGVDGNLDFNLAPATTVDTLSVLVNHIGLPTFHQFKISSNDLNLTIGGSSMLQVPNASNGSLKVKASALPTPQKVNGYYILGSWDNQGLPNYLWTPNDKISTDLLSDINASLPEQIKLPVSHPEYLTSNDEGSIVLIEDAEVWVTFVHEGAGYLNALGYYTHPNDIPPSAKTTITDATIIFPNVSYKASSGSLTSGNKVQLLYLDQTTNTYTNVFPKGTTVAWFFVANGFSGSKVGAGNGIYYSDKRFNPEKVEAKRKHNVILNDTKRQLLLIGFEDINRENGSDEDFNDGVFYSTVTPYTAVKTNNFKPLDTPVNKDADGDGVSDSRDEYPNDKERAFNNYYPGKNEVGTLAFEDLWPNKGDYDFNDLIVDYNYNQITNAKNEVVSMEAAVTVRAIGASFKNGFGFELNQSPDNIKSVSGYKISENFISLNQNGTEKNQTKAVVIAFDNAFNVLKHIEGSGVNTTLDNPYQTPTSLLIDVDLVKPVPYNDFGTPPHNPFMIIRGERGKEVHLPGSAPTSLADLSLLGTGNDDSDISKEKYYMSDKYLPWAINIPVKFDYPAEKQDITKTFLKFLNWASSRGYNYMDWYVDKPGYRDSNKVFKNK